MIKLREWKSVEERMEDGSVGEGSDHKKDREDTEEVMEEGA